jgi:hypothetical protein
MARLLARKAKEDGHRAALPNIQNKEAEKAAAAAMWERRRAAAQEAGAQASWH